MNKDDEIKLLRERVNDLEDQLIECEEKNKKLKELLAKIKSLIKIS